MQALTINNNSKLISGEGALDQLFDQLPAGAETIALVTGNHFSHSEAYRRLKQQAQSQSLKLCTFIVGPEPTTRVIDEIITDLPQLADVVIGIGGGSALDAAKAVAVMLTSEGCTADYLEGVGNRTAQPRTIPFFAVPTTSGTGSEATKNAVFIKPGEVKHKKSIRHDSYIPDLVIIDPLLMLGCPSAVTAACGFDAIAQLLEAYISVTATPETDEVCFTGLTYALEVFPDVCAQRAADPEAREKMAYAAYLSGVGLANAGLANIHGIAGPIGGEIAVPHGVAVASIFPELVEIIGQRSPTGSVALEKLNRVGELLSGGDDQAGWQRLVQFLRRARAQYLGSSLADYGLTPQGIQRIARESSDKNSPVSLSEVEIVSLLSQIVAAESSQQTPSV